MWDFIKKRLIVLNSLLPRSSISELLCVDVCVSVTSGIVHKALITDRFQGKEQSDGKGAECRFHFTFSALLSF